MKAAYKFQTHQTTDRVTFKGRACSDMAREITAQLVPFIANEDEVEVRIHRIYHPRPEPTKGEK